jgi:predicted dehydrogenase
MGDIRGDDVRAAIIGMGFIGAVHLRAARQAGAEVVGVGARSRDQADAAARAHHIRRAYASPDEVAGDPEVEVVHVCTPNRDHAPYVRAALAAGKHVICEKPIGIDAGEAFEMTEAAARAGVIAAVPFGYRYYPMVRELRALVRGGLLGSADLVHGRYLQDWLADRDAVNWRMEPARGGASRAFADIGSHWCDLAEFVTGMRITAVDATLRRRDGTDDAALVHLQIGDAMGSLLVSQISRGHRNRLEIEVDGVTATAIFDQERPDELVVAEAGSERVLYRGDAALSGEAQALSILPPGHPQGFNDMFAAFVATAYAAMRDGVADEGLPLFADGLRAARIVEAVMTSDRERRWVEIAR